MPEKKLTPEEFVERELAIGQKPQRELTEEEKQLEKELLDQMTPDKTLEELMEIIKQAPDVR